MALLDEGFSTYIVEGEGSPCEVEKLFTHLVMKCDDNASVSADNY